MKIVLPDVNGWLALTFQRHAHHVSAYAWLNAAADSGCSFCRITQQGFLRLATNPTVFATEAVSLAEAWRLYDTWMRDPRVVFTAEPDDLETHWRGYTQGQTFSPKVWNDAYLAAFAHATNGEVVTVNKGFKQYRGLQVTILS